MREQIRDKSRLAHILESIDNLFEFTKDMNINDYKTNKILRFAVVKNLEIIGEASYKLTQELKDKYPDIAWRQIIGMRHLMVHGYYLVEDEIVWEIIQKDLQPLKEQIQTMYNNEYVSSALHVSLICPIEINELPL